MPSHLFIKATVLIILLQPILRQLTWLLLTSNTITIKMTVELLIILSNISMKSSKMRVDNKRFLGLDQAQAKGSLKIAIKTSSYKEFTVIMFLLHKLVLVQFKLKFKKREKTASQNSISSFAKYLKTQTPSNLLFKLIKTPIKERKWRALQLPLNLLSPHFHKVKDRLKQLLIISKQKNQLKDQLFWGLKEELILERKLWFSILTRHWCTHLSNL